MTAPCEIRLAMQPLHELAGHIGPVHSLACTYEGLLLSGGRDGVLRLWDPSAGALLDEVAAGQGDLDGLACSPGRLGLAASLGKTGSVRVWEVVVKQCGARLYPMADLAIAGGSSVAMDLTGARLAVGFFSGGVELWDLGSRSRVWECAPHRHRVAALAWSRSGRILGSAGWDETLCVLDAGTGEPAAPALALAARGMCLAGDGESFLCGLWNGAIIRADASGRKGLDVSGHYEAVTALACSGRFLASAALGKATALRRLDNGSGCRFLPQGPCGGPGREVPDLPAPLPSTVTGDFAHVFALAFGPEASFLATAGADGKVRIWPLGLCQTANGAAPCNA